MRYLLLVLAAFSSVAYAGKDQGNGGNVVICGSQIELLDHYEARVLRKIQIDLGAASLSFMEKVTLAISRIEHLNPNRAKLYKSWARQFLNEAFFTDEELIPLPDNGPGTIPSECKLRQIAVQQTPNLPGDYRYIIKKPLWDQLDNDGKAGLVLHEIVYRELLNQRSLPQTTSKFARYFNALLSSHAFSTMTLKAYFDLLYLLDFERGDAQQGTEIGLYGCEYDGNCAKHIPTFWSDNVLQSGFTPNRDFDTDSSIAYWRGIFVQIADNFVRFSQDGELTGDYRIRDSLVHLQMGPVDVAIALASDSRINIHDDRSEGVLKVYTGLAEFKWQNRNIYCRELEILWGQKKFYCGNGWNGEW